MWVHVTLGVQANCWVLKDGAVPLFPDSRKVARGKKCDLSKVCEGQRGMGSPLPLPWGTGQPTGPCAPWLLFLMACVVWSLFLSFFKIQHTLIVLNSSQNEIEGESELSVLKYSLWDLSWKYMRPLRIKFELKINLYQVKGLLFFICFSKITSVAVLSTTLACGGTELPFLMKAWAWASCQHSRGRRTAQRDISRDRSWPMSRLMWVGVHST